MVYKSTRKRRTHTHKKKKRKAEFRYTFMSAFTEPQQPKTKHELKEKKSTWKTDKEI